MINTFKKILLLAFLCAAINLNAQDLNIAIPLNSKIKQGKLENGLRYLIIQNKKPEKKIELRIVVNAGSILEDDDQQGLAHFMEHMNFNGLKHFPHNEVVHYLQSIGVQFGADLNAYTSFDETVYILPVPSENKSKVDSAFTILADWSGAALLDNKEIDSERGVVLEESRLGKGADDRMFKKWFPRFLNGSHYAERLPIGKDELLKNFKYEVVKRFHHDWYRPDLECVIVVGDIEPLEAERLIKEKFSGFKNPTQERVRPISFDLPARKANETMVLSDAEANYTLIQIIGNSYKSNKAGTKLDYRNDLIELLFNSSLGQRYEELKNSANPPFIYGGANIGGGFARYWKNFSLYAVCGNDKMKEATSALVVEAMRVKKLGFTEAELQRAKSSLLSMYENNYKERDKTESSSLVNELVRHFLENEAVPGIEWEYDFVKQIVGGITLDEINTFSKKIDIDANYFAFITAKISDKLPTDADLKNWIDAALLEKSLAYQEKALATHLLENEPVAGKIVKEDKNEKLGITTYQLSNGAKVTIKPTDFKNDQIVLKAQRFGGASLYEGKDYQSANYSNNVVDDMGYGKFSNTDLPKFLAGKVVSLEVGVDVYTENIDGNSSIKDMETMFQLLYLKCTSPRTDEVAFKSFINRGKQTVEAYKLNPEYSFADSSHFVMYGKNPRAHIIPVVSDYDNIDMNHAVQFYKDRIGSAYGMNYVIVGSFKENEIKPLIEKYIGGLPGTVISIKYKDLNIDPIQGKNSFTFHKGKEEKSKIIDYAYGNIKYDINDELYTFLLSSVINNRIIDTLREKMGGIYGGGARVSISKYPKETYMVQSYLPCGPQNVEKLEKAYWDIIEGAKKAGGVTQLDLTKVNESAIQSYKVSVKTNEYWLESISKAELLGNDPGRILTLIDRINAVTPKNLVETANKYLNSTNVFKSVWLPEEKK